jgi:hypothetical protein
MPYPSERFSSSAAVPTVTGGRCPLAVTGRCACRCVVANHIATSLASAGLRAFLRCRVRSAKRLLPASSARAPLGLFLKRAGGVLPRVPSGEAVSVRDRIGGPGRARARSASRPNSDFGEDTELPSPDPEDPARVVPAWHSPPRSEGAGRARVRRRDVAAPSLRSAILPKDRLLCRSDPNRFLFPWSRGPRYPPDLHRRARPQGDESL